ncbi:hypothetical protein DQ182_04075 [Enterococcus faecium]|nr:hypothetical protein [Enterococcus faecium]EGP5249227.1 hypothetical protein [Enterococcus faecium]EGP5392914.1 hypothetical protein [Enterococcus faecium]EGP5415140.1 hypothetical protein [Enterococcus faecium]EGP5711223.1 hypothetical protein [Enterococcus faecium]
MCHNLFDKRCSKASFSVVSLIYAKMWKPMFTKFFLLLETKRLCHNLLINGVQSADPRYSLITLISQPLLS